MQVRIFLSSQVYVRYGKEGWFMVLGKGARGQKKSEHAQANASPWLARVGGEPGQAALDFLTEYGWAIALVVIIAAVFFALGVFDPAGMSGNRASGFIDVAANGWYLAPVRLPAPGLCSPAALRKLGLPKTASSQTLKPPHRIILIHLPAECI